ncbi:MAG: hypothetical protein CMI05_08255 [Oceanospirillaceae bacterium]|nr:hypothetical protein [Oceanospirillaceae bacterium]
MLLYNVIGKTLTINIIIFHLILAKYLKPVLNSQELTGNTLHIELCKKIQSLREYKLPPNIGLLIMTISTLKFRFTNL